ncbi:MULTISPECIES: HIT domain-containing protein [unclassified Aliivibrio]|jgi:diadenosine tetraphosphate (Ap4A) HIT family hydrolase|uniref:HIT domain-containing protein n=1 Tax=unclassified Aliivibrio TaxID=2645654 RepID=UPI00080E685E|nr:MULTISPECIES: HIT domain-containing protein [unclassified Aliivibrio]OCH12821.1 HIT family hydrolase [Aliivibrio sp. 1S165]OCH16307.1 HIT family hydrolase [Aliivibrio sp. 1S128]OCH28491.1 HIT family hydrolase [Aliivibrio sp. 1S175]
MAFQLHSRLQQDCIVLGNLPLCQVLLIKEDIGPWLILVPRLEDLKEIHHMNAEQQHQFIKESSAVAQLLEDTFTPDKINIGALGNLVPQLHIHHIARFTHDIAWPGPVWGNTNGVIREQSEQTSLVYLLRDKLDALSGFKR